MMTARSGQSAGPILLIGRSGQIGWELERTLASLGPLVAVGHQEMDLALPDTIRDCIRKISPGLIVNAAAYTAVDNAEGELSPAMAVNGTAPGILAEEAKRLRAPLIHYSTDYVFGERPQRGPDGKIRPYIESDDAAPTNEYGRTKLAGERAVQAVGSSHLILRTSWVYASRGRNFLRTMQNLAAEREELRIVVDQIGSPTWARMVAEATAQILAETWSVSGSESLAEKGGLYHLSAAGCVSWYGFAEAILAAAEAAGKRVPRLVPVPTSEYPLPAARPTYSVLNCSAVRTTFGVSLPDWRHQLKLCLASSECSRRT
jgi:dTDP-4-dehydrorhamnose reductase